MPQGSTWGPSGQIVFARDTVWSVPDGGGVPRELTHLNADGEVEARHMVPSILPGNQWLLFTALPGVTTGITLV